MILELKTEEAFTRQKKNRRGGLPQTEEQEESLKRLVYLENGKTIQNKTKASEGGAV